MDEKISDEIDRKVVRSFAVVGIFVLRHNNILILMEWDE